MKTPSRWRIYSLLFLVPLVAGASECDPETGRVDIVLVNLYKNKNATPSYERRLETTASLIRDRTASGPRRWDVVAMNEAFNFHRSHWYYGTWKVPRAIQCTSDGQVKLTAACMNDFLYDPEAPENSHYQFAGNALLARGSRLKPIGSWRGSYLQPWNFMGATNATWYSIVGRRFGIGDTDKVVPIYLVKMPTSSSTMMNRKHQAQGSLDRIRQWWQAGDLTPILIGDINATYYDEVGQVFGRDFVEAYRAIKKEEEARIETIWVGKEKAFPGAGGTFEFADHGFWDEFTHGGTSDHPAAYAQLHALTWESKTTLDHNPVAIGGDGPALTRAVMAWTPGHWAFNDIQLSRLPDSGQPIGQWPVRWPGASHNIRSRSGPALMRKGARTFLAWRGLVHDKVNIIYNDNNIGSVWTGRRTKFNYTTDRAPSMAVLGDTIFLAWRDDRTGYVRLTRSTNNGDHWSTPATNWWAITPTAPTLAAFRGKLWLSWLDANERIQIMAADRYGNWDWRTRRTMPKVTSHVGPTLLTAARDSSSFRKYAWSEVADRLYLLWPGRRDGYVRIMASPDGLDWSHAVRVTGEQTPFRVAGKFDDDAFLVAHTDWSTRYIKLLRTPVGGEISIDVRE